MSEEQMPEEQKKGAKLLAFWLFGTVLIVFAAITAYIYLYTAGVATIGQVIMTGLPIWGITAVAAIIIYVVYYFLTKRQG
jgi:cell division septal protein FtsQ